MKVKIIKDGEETELTLRMKGKHQEQIWDKIRELTEDGKDSGEKAISLFNTLVDIACELTSMTKEQLNDLDVDEKNKITVAIKDKAMSVVGFTKP